MMFQAFLLPGCMRLRRALSFLDVGVLACAVDGFFSARVSNPQTRRAYGRSGRRFLNCCGGLTGFSLGSLLGCLTLLTAAAWAQTQAGYRIDTFAGTRAVRDNGPATSARLRFPSGVAVDGAGNLFIADTNNHRIRKVDSAGVITTVAGTGETGFSGDGGPAIQAALEEPSGVTVDGAGNLFIADTNNHRIRKVDSAGVITTVAGTGERFGGFGTFSGDGGPAIQAALNGPSGVAVDGAGNLFIADRYNHRIRKVDSAGVITTVAGTGEFGFSGDGGPAIQAALNGPSGVAVDGAGNLFIADSDNHRIRKVDSAGVITTVAGTGESGFGGDGGPAVEAELYGPSGVAVDGAGNLFIADSDNHRIRKVDSAGVITTVAGTGESGFGGDGDPAIQAALDEPSGVAVDGAGNLFIADNDNHRIRKVDSAGVITTVAGTGETGFSGDGGPAIQAALEEPSGVAVDGAGNLFIADYNNHCIRKVDATGTITTIAGSCETGFLGGGFSGDGGPAASARLRYPRGVAVDGAGNLFIADRYNHEIRKVDAAGTITTVAGTGEPGFAGQYGGDGGPAIRAALNGPSGVAVDGAGNLFIADTNNHRIRKVDSAGVITTVAGTRRFGGDGGFSGDGGPAKPARLRSPSGVAVDGAGNLFIADSGNHRIRKVDATGTITTVAGTGRTRFRGDGGPAIQAALNAPSGVAVDGAGNLFIADTNNHRIRKVDSAGVITTVAGTGETGFSGDGGPAIQAALDEPSGVAVDGAGNLFIADSGNHVVRKLTPVGSSTPTQPGKPLAPTFLAATPYSLTVEWTEPENTGTAITDYDVQYREVGSGSFTDAQHEGTALRATLTGLSPDTVYAVQVRAGTATGTGEWSESGEGKTSPLPTGDQIYYFPHLAVGARWQTTITYINYSPQEVICQTEFLSDQGGPLMVSFADRGAVVSRTDVLPPGGSVHQETNVELSAPLAPGWAWATCSGPVKASLLYRGYDSEGVPVAEAGVNAATVAATRFVTFAEQGEGKSGTGVAYANPSATEAAVTFTARDAVGQMLASVSQELPAGGHGAQNMALLFGLTGFTGSLEVTSTEPIVTLSLNFEAAPVFSSLPPGELDAAAQGSTTYYFPHLAVGEGWQTTITYINYSPQEVSCQTEFISDFGNPLMVSFAGRGTVVSRNDVLPPGGSVHQETNVDLSAPLAPGWARATCTGPVKASLLFRQHSSEGAPVAEGGVNAATVPATHFVTFAERGEGKSGTGVAYANPSATAAVITFTARDADGRILASIDKTLLPNGHGAQNMAPLFGLSSFAGSLEITSTAPIVTLSLNFEAAPVFSSLPPGELDAADIPGGMLAPANESAFNDLFVGKRAATTDPTIYVDYLSPGRFRETEGADTYTGSYTYQNTGSNTGTLTFSYDDGERCTSSLTFISTTAATETYTCNDGSSGKYTWQLVEIPASAGAPDLVVQTPSVSDSTPNAGESFTLSAAVRNQGNGRSASTTLRYYRSPDATISTSDTAVGTDAVGGLAASGTSAESISLTAPSTAGTYYYGACVDPVSGESDTGNNCSNSRAVTVRSGSTAVTIPDANLRAAVEAALGKASGAPITAADMETLTNLSAREAGISDLTGLESAANLTELYLGWNNISDPSPLADLTELKLLELQSNNTSNLSFLASLTNLTYLSLEFNGITDISPLSGLTNLTELYLGWNNISDPSPLADLTKLKRLDLQSNNTSNLSFLTGLTNLTYLSLGFNGITDISPLSGLINLTELWMYGNRITDVSPLSGLITVTTLVLWDNDVTDISPLSGLVNLSLLALSSNPITNLLPLGSLTNLTKLDLFGIKITNLSTLASWLPGRTNLEYLNLGATDISDISLLAGLTNLTFLHLGRNNVSDLSPLSGLTNLTELRLFENNIADVSPLAGLTSLTGLSLGTNDLTDVSALGGLVRLSELDLGFNRVTDISALTDLTRLTRLDLRGNPLSDSSINDHIPAIESSGASVFFDSFRKGDYDIELVFSDHFTERQKNVLQYAVRRWMAVITEDLPDYEFNQGWSGTCGDQSYEIPAGERIDDLRIYMGTFEGGGAVGYGGPSVVRQETHLPVLGCMAFDLSSANLLITGLHEIGHVLGFGPIWDELGFLQDLDGDTHFNGPLAIAAFDEAGGSDYTGAKVPVQKMGGGHWRYSAFPDELMRPGGGSALSAITVQSMADLGYGVDVTQADPYTLPGATSAQARAKTTAAIASIPGDDLLTEGPEGAEPVAPRGFDLRNSSLTMRLAPPSQAAPMLSCGLDLGLEPIIVVDQEGRIIRIGN